MRVDLFDFTLPPDRIALRPAEPRESARLLDIAPDAPLADRRIADLPTLLRPGDVLVVNDTRVIPARLSGLRRRAGTEARIEATLIRRTAPDTWRAFLKPAKKVADGEAIAFGRDDDALDAVCLEHVGEGEVALRFSCAGAAIDDALARHGTMPLPPYIAGKRAVDAQDDADYQTIFAREPGAVAAPTASLHFTPALLDAIRARSVEIATLTLHVGAGTFLPVKAEDTDDHHMHAEWGTIDAATAALLNEARAKGGRLVAAGTTSLRLLESAAREDGTLQPFHGETSIFIAPGYRFRAVDCLLTNFHLPRSTLFMLVAAFAGLERMQAAYAHAIAAHYRFYSYGDACFLHRAPA
ncbi:S-adenosylmethionine:tRNA ribosyltransferase-isomerase [Beijerinckiaceae bacterium RH AL1]|nr:tRNA preQ1(34) S-adenosylmethionine ribosyltransferase-isomerase QueA [Beijerinckiaceae bacterium]VVB46645.1 S-adenosylmethionine:tRNA ribosyltransferase-isomerase [Beijerinckiaceae bacterium RH CH11]VVB46729.1 S-adenosylmethionine:tRNA ribosyltransferase-isomerase [Beijerinckiaceae bacterium RH AL8]VVC55479.1 S-adenosylmethionine:tRNA ribosyltransferase-isomerase [Beijerinckiaceae bacterium RH AL1]